MNKSTAQKAVERKRRLVNRKRRIQWRLAGPAWKTSSCGETTKCTWTPSGVVRSANDRGNQENLIKQLKGGARALQMPVDNLVSNWAYMVMASLAWTRCTPCQYGDTHCGVERHSLTPG